LTTAETAECTKNNSTSGSNHNR